MRCDPALCFVSHIGPEDTIPAPVIDVLQPYVNLYLNPLNFEYYLLYSCIKSLLHRNEDDVASKHENEDEVDEELSDTKEKDKEKEKEVENDKISDESPTINEQKESTAEPMEIGESKLAEAEAEVGAETVDADRPNSSGRIIFVFNLLFLQFFHVNMKNDKV